MVVGLFYRLLIEGIRWATGRSAKKPAATVSTEKAHTPQ